MRKCECLFLVIALAAPLAGCGRGEPNAPKIDGTAPTQPQTPPPTGTAPVQAEAQTDTTKLSPE